MAKLKGLKILICGDRECDDYALLEEAIKESGFEISEVVSGGAKGGDLLGETWAKKNKVKVKQFKPDWNDLKADGAIIKEKENPWTKKIEKYNANAGFARNSDMVDYCDGAIALQPNGPTNGTQDTIKKIQKANKKLFIWPSEEKRDWEYIF